MQEYYDALKKVMEYVQNKQHIVEAKEDVDAALYWQDKCLTLLIINGEMLKDVTKEDK